MSNVATQMKRAAEDTRNDAVVEALWASKAFSHAETYMKLLHAFKDKPTPLRLTKCDDEIYTQFRAQFPDVKVDVFDLDASKTTEGKEAWRKFMEAYTDEIVKDFNFATLMRVDVSKPCDQENTCIVPRIQFLAIELARTREGFNKDPKLE